MRDRNWDFSKSFIGFHLLTRSFYEKMSCFFQTAFRVEKSFPELGNPMEKQKKEQPCAQCEHRHNNAYF